MRIFLVSMVLALLMVGCRKSPMESTSKKLYSGMTKADVNTLFSNFSFVTNGSGSGDFDFATKLETNRTCASWIIYGKKPSTAILPDTIMEECSVYFDTYGVVIGYRYLLMN
jgi:hypothetical protein